MAPVGLMSFARVRSHLIPNPSCMDRAAQRGKDKETTKSLPIAHGAMDNGKNFRLST